MKRYRKVLRWIRWISGQVHECDYLSKMDQMFNIQANVGNIQLQGTDQLMYAEQNDDFNRRSIQHTIIGKYIKSKREIMNDLIKIE